MNKWMKGWINERMDDGRMNERMDDGWMNEWTVWVPTPLFTAVKLH